MFLGQCLIPVQENYNQLGVIIDHKCRRSTGITEAVNRTMHFPILALSFSIQTHYCTYTKLLCYIPLYLDVNSGTAYPLLISRISIPPVSSLLFALHHFCELLAIYFS